jgi:membrane glycosyltransferase
MDGVIELRGGGGPATALEREPVAGMPPEARAPMPEQRLDRFDPKDRRAFVDPRSHSRAWPRLVVLGGTALVTTAATAEMYRSLALGGLTVLEALIVFLFALNLGWIALTFVSAAAGAVIVARRRTQQTPSVPVTGRTAVLMPVHNEKPARIFAAIEAMASRVNEIANGSTFDWFVLSDTTDPDVAIAEEVALLELRARLGDQVRLYYRRRHRNTGRKAGNVADFCRRWGSNYDYLLVLDADSLMDPASIVELARRMDADPDAGLIQTVPQLVHAKTVFARLHQFAGRVYGPVIAAGFAWWSASEGNYWGHNAIIRKKAFMESAALPTLRGAPPFGGHILSHDFVEAALIRRAGWTVRVADDIAGSYEETPPSLIDFAVRDRRWCQGNLQHARVVAGAGLHWVSRFHLVHGIMAYVASPLWLLLIAAGLVMAVQANFTPPDYFEDPFQQFPTWPRINSQVQIELLVMMIVLLLGPKLFGLATVMMQQDLRRQFGGAGRMMASFGVELALSILIAPIMMLIQSGVIASILAGKDAGWRQQQREGCALTVRQALRSHRWQIAGGLGLAGAAWWVSPGLLAWLSPAVAGLLLAAPVSAFTASPLLGRLLRRRGLLVTPEERVVPLIGRATLSYGPRHRTALSLLPDIRCLVSEQQRRRLHLALLDQADDRPGDIDPVEAVAAAKIGRARNLEEALAYLLPDEQAIALAMPALFTQLTSLPPAETPSLVASRS